MLRCSSDFVTLAGAPLACQPCRCMLAIKYRLTATSTCKQLFAFHSTADATQTSSVCKVHSLRPQSRHKILSPSSISGERPPQKCLKVNPSRLSLTAKTAVSPASPVHNSSYATADSDPDNMRHKLQPACVGCEEAPQPPLVCSHRRRHWHVPHARRAAAPNPKRLPTLEGGHQRKKHCCMPGPAAGTIRARPPERFTSTWGGHR